MAFGKNVEHKELPNSKNILESITDLDIFEMYLGSIPTKPISSPLREDTKPSFSLFMSREHGKIFFKDFSTGESGDCFLFVMRLFRLGSKVSTFNKIAKDFNLNHLKVIDNSFATSPIKSYVKNKKSIITYKLRITVKIRPWMIRDREYWQKKYGLGKEQLEYCMIYPISHYFVNGACNVAKSLAYAFVEEKDGLQTFKIYQPFAPKSEKWTNNNDFSTWELWTQLPDSGEILIVTSSRKDAAVIKSLFPSKEITSCALQSEGVNPKDSVVNELKGRFKEIFVMYDNDFKSDKNRGRIAGAKLAKQTDFLQIEIPDGCGVKDPSDYVDVFDGKNLKRLILSLITKRLRDEELKQIL
jgi:hypothetical protein|tara:strand:+ start:494 stop:1561 length:1068 start_codon:yes stop_codon:yes gene_type:complete